MAQSVFAVANYFLELARHQGKKLDPMQLQKLVYFAHGWHLGLTESPLILEDIEAWDYGPVVPELYHELKRYGARPIPDLIEQVDGLRVFKPNVVNASTRALLRKVWDVYGGLSAVQLSEMTHRPGTPWTEMRRMRGMFKGPKIPESLMRDYFRRLSRENAGQPGPADNRLGA